MNAMEIVQSLELPPDSRSDEITLQLLECRQCGFRGLAVYEESRRGPFDSESWEHAGWHVPPAQWEWISGLMLACPHPENPRCGCHTHKKLGLVDYNGRWCGLDQIEYTDEFALTWLETPDPHL